jgi:hypothetical protein
MCVDLGTALVDPVYITIETYNIVTHMESTVREATRIAIGTIDHYDWAHNLSKRLEWG